MAQPLQPVGHNRQEKAADEFVRWPGHDLEAIALASVAAGKVHLTVMHIDDTVVGDGHPGGRAPEIVEHLRRSCHRPLGIDNPRLGIEPVDAVPPGLS
jgi:hypothetical protein